MCLSIKHFQPSKWPLHSPNASLLTKDSSLVVATIKRYAIISLRDDAGIDLLKCLCGTIKEKRGDKEQGAYTGTKSSLKIDFDFIAVGVGYDQPTS